MNENNQTENSTPAKKEKLTHREKRARWKAAKKAKKQELREYYRYAPWPKKLWNLGLKKVLKTVFILVLILGVLAANMETIFKEIVVPIMRASIMEQRNKPLTDEQKKQIYQLSPIDEEGAERIDALPASKADETWSICVYFVGADLEDDTENDLSYVTSLMTREAKQDAAIEKQMTMMDRLSRYNTELADNGLELPKFFYYPDVPVASSKVVTQDVHVSTRTGMASADILELTSGVWSDNIQIVIQTGGANRWHTGGIPARGTARFVYDENGLHPLGSIPDVDMGTGAALEDFLRFGKENFSADHSVFVFWNHGGGSVGGICYDERTQNMISLDEVRRAFGSVYDANAEHPPFEVIGFDACLMATVDALASVHGYSRYMVASEEQEPGCGWNYTGWVGALAKNPAMGGAALGKAICDSYVEGCQEYDAEEMATLSVADVAKAPALISAYGAYGVEAKDIIVTVHAFDLQERRFVDIPCADCGYGYRTSYFKTVWKGRYIVTAVTFRLSTVPQPKLDYGGVRKALTARYPGWTEEDRGSETYATLGLSEGGAHLWEGRRSRSDRRVSESLSSSAEILTPQMIRDTVIAIREQKLPDPKEIGSAGSFFCNPVIDRAHFERIVALARKENGPEYEVPHYEVGERVKVPAAWMIDQCGFKGAREGGAQVYPKQPLVIVNATGQAAPEEIVTLERRVIDTIREKYGINLHPEVEHVGGLPADHQLIR